MASLTTNEAVQKKDYFANRGVPKDYYSNYRIPVWLQTELPKDKSARLLDIGCGYGHFLNRLKEAGYNNAQGIDINDESVARCNELGLKVTQISSIKEFAQAHSNQFQLITMSHVLEHINKEEIIDTVAQIKGMLAPGGAFIVMVPNGQTNTGAYWMYEDFTHTTLFTAGSLLYVLKGGGFTDISILDPLDSAHLTGFAKWKRHFLTRLYEINLNFWNRATGASFHVPSPRVYTFEIKGRGKK